MKLELASPAPLSMRSLVSRFADFPPYLLVPDPEEKRDPIYVRSDLLARFPDSYRNAIINFSKYWNTPREVSDVQNSVNKFKSALNDEGEGTDWGAIVETAGDVINVVGDLFDGNDGSGTGTPAQVGSIVSLTGFVACIAEVSGGIVGVGVHPGKRQIIAFSSPETFNSMFPNLPPQYGSPELPYIKVPPLKAGFLQFALTHPDMIVREKSSGGFEVVPGGQIIGHDNNGNPITNVPPPEGGDSGSGGSSILPYAAAALLLLR